MHEILLNIIKNSIFFLSRYYLYPKVAFVSVFIIQTAEMKMIFIVTQKDFLLHQIQKNTSTEEIDNFLEIVKKISKNKI